MHKLVCEKTWREYSRHSIMMRGHREFIVATRQITEHLTEIVRNAHSDTDLKEQVLSFLIERERFIDYAEKHPPQP